MADTKGEASYEKPETVSDEEKQVESPSSEWTLVSSLTVVGAFCSLFCSVGVVNAFGVFQEYYHTHKLQSYSNFAINWIFSFTTFAMFLGAAPAGLLIDKVGPRPIIGGGGCGMLLGIFMTSLCHEYWQFFLAQGVLIGFSLSFLTIPCMAIVSRRFNKYRGIAIGLVIAGSSTGGIVWPILVDAMLHTYHISFGWTMRILGFVMMPLLALATVLIQDKKDSNKAKELDKHIGSQQPQKKKKKKPDLSIAKDPTYLLFVAGYTVYCLAMFVPIFFVTSFAVEKGMGASFGFHLLSILNAASLVGRIGMGLLADLYGPFNLSSAAAILSAVVAFCWTKATSQGGIIVWCLAYGFLSGAILSLVGQCAAKLSTHETHGTAMGLAMAISSVSGLVGSPIAGELVARGWLAVSMYSGAALMSGGVLMTFSRLRLHQELFVKV